MKLYSRMHHIPCDPAGLQKAEKGMAHEMATSRLILCNMLCSEGLHGAATQKYQVNECEILACSDEYQLQSVFRDSYCAAELFCSARTQGAIF